MKFIYSMASLWPKSQEGFSTLPSASSWLYHWRQLSIEIRVNLAETSFHTRPLQYYSKSPSQIYKKGRCTNILGWSARNIPGRSWILYVMYLSTIHHQHRTQGHYSWKIRRWKDENVVANFKILKSWLFESVFIKINIRNISAFLY